jgi:hypothetical protein
MNDKIINLEEYRNANQTPDKVIISVDEGQSNDFISDICSAIEQMFSGEDLDKQKMLIFLPPQGDEHFDPSDFFMNMFNQSEQMNCIEDLEARVQELESDLNFSIYKDLGERFSQNISDLAQVLLENAHNIAVLSKEIEKFANQNHQQLTSLMSDTFFTFLSLAIKMGIDPKNLASNK